MRRHCDRGAVPAIGSCYGLKMIVDNEIAEQPEIWFEAGDHATLVHMSQADFARLTAGSKARALQRPLIQVSMICSTLAALSPDEISSIG